MRRAAALAAAALLLARGTQAEGRREVELGVEDLAYRTTASALNRDDILGLDATEQVLRASLGLKEIRGSARAVFRGYVERAVGSRPRTDWIVRQAYVQYAWGPGLMVRAGKQRIAWGSGLAWNPTNRVEPPKNALNTSLEQEGPWAARLDVSPASWVSLVLVGARGETRVRDLPFTAPTTARRTAALRARFLVMDTDLAVVFSGGAGQRTLVGFDLGRDVHGLAVHAEGALQHGAELRPERSDRTFFRLAAGALKTWGETAVALEYFYNGEGYTSAASDAYLAGLDRSYAAALDPRLPPAVRDAGRQSYLGAALLPYSGGLGLRRHYVHGSWSRSGIGGKWTLAARAVAGLSDGGVAVTPGLGWAARDNLTMNLDAIVLVGPARSEYRLAPVRAALQGRVRLLF